MHCSFTVHLLLVVDRREYLVHHHPFDRRIASNAAVHEHSINGKTQFLVLSHSHRRRGRVPSPLMNRQQHNNSTAAYHEWLFSPAAKYRGLIGSKKRGTQKLRRILHGRGDDEKMSDEIRGHHRFE